MKTSTESPAQIWDDLAARERPSWYLDPLVAQQKRQAHLDLIREAAASLRPGPCLKTDLFEDAHGSDALLPDLIQQGKPVLGLDLSFATARAAASRFGDLPDRARRPLILAADVRRLPFRTGSIEAIVSNSTLDHFDSAVEFDAALGELVRVLKPGGLLVITTDNPWNPLYWPLRWSSRQRGAPFPLGYTPSVNGLTRKLRARGLQVDRSGTLLHNPRLLSTVAFLALRRCLGRRADSPIRALLRLFATGEKLPSRWITACFVYCCARKPVRMGTEEWPSG